MKIYLNSIENVKLFNTMAILFKGEVILKSGRYNIDGKSIFGIFSLDLTKPLVLEVECKDEFKKEDFINDLKTLKFILEE